ncbi:MAG: 1-(5-phosphoribosyl)-5-[(5-phosphoribosylamino)methylideneamino]imidazole-4-carboxamide isomerase [Ruminococcaceae bacterium]|nr:1-(5-phosphoribosyl)-5-[(5-phosphoribosylamino)methylideneamino]imidazole-4-carboxamide isomerase [Oscillospiraceae bacterium]
MNLIPAIDLIGGQAVRLKKGDYNQVTVYSKEPVEVAKSFEKQGASFLHIVDLDGAKNGSTANFSTIEAIVSQTNLSVEVGGGIRTMETVETYLSLGVDRIILGTAAVTDREFLKQAVEKYPKQTAVGIDIRDGLVAIKGWTEVSDLSCFDFCRFVENIGVQTVICTDISKDGMMLGTNLQLYRDLCREFHMNIIASGGVSTMEDIQKLSEIKLYGAILGKALYTGSIDLAEAIAKTKENT